MKKSCKVKEYVGEEDAFFGRINVLIGNGWKVVKCRLLPPDHSSKATLCAEMKREIPDPPAVAERVATMPIGDINQDD